MIRFHDQNSRFSSSPAQSQRAIKRSRFEAGAQGYFGKPFHQDEITVTLRAAVKIQTTWTTFLRSVFTSLMPRSHPYTFRAPIVSDQPFRVFYPKLASAPMFTVGHFVLPFFIANSLRQWIISLPHVSKNLDSERNIKQGAAHLK